MGGLDEKRRAAQERWSQRTQGDLPVIFVGTASCGRAAGALETLQAVRATLVELGKDAHIVEVGCIGPCYLEPLMDVAHARAAAGKLCQCDSGKSEEDPDGLPVGK